MIYLGSKVMFGIRHSTTFALCFVSFKLHILPQAVSACMLRFAAHTFLMLAQAFTLLKSGVFQYFMFIYDFLINNKDFGFLERICYCNLKSDIDGKQMLFALIMIAY